MSAPDWVMLLPCGPDLKARDGRHWTYEAAEVVADFAANRGPLVIDYEHAQDLQATNGHEAPAAGWIIEMEERDGAVWARVEWTKRAIAYIEERSYRYLSPSLRQTRDGQIIGLNGAGLVNRPALLLPPLDDQDGIASERHLERAAAALASAARTYQTEQAALGRQITISEAVAAVNAERAIDPST